MTTSAPAKTGTITSTLSNPLADHPGTHALLDLPVRKQWQQDLQRLLRHRGALVGLFILALLLAAAILAPRLAPYPYDEQHLEFIRVAPNGQFWLGTDSLGRDMLSRLLHGARIAFLIALVVVVIEVVIGVPLGMMAGYFRGRIDLTIGILTDIVGFPGPGPGLGHCGRGGAGSDQFGDRHRPGQLGTLHPCHPGQGHVPAPAGVCRGQHCHRRLPCPHPAPTYSAQYPPHRAGPGDLDPARSLAGRGRPQLSGLWCTTPTPEWGAMLNEGRNYIQGAPWIATFPGLAILITLIGFNLLGDGLRDTLDPKQRS